MTKIYEDFFKLILITILVLFSINTNIFAASYYDLITELGSSARMISLGNIEGFDYSSSAIFENPASLGLAKDFSAGIFSTTLIDEVTYYAISASYRSQYGMLGIGIMAASVDDIAITSQEQSSIIKQVYATEYTNYLNSILKIAYQYSLNKNWHAGLAISSYLHKLHTVYGAGLDTDTGVFYTSDNLAISFCLKNLLSSPIVYNNDYEEKLPQQMVTSVMYNLDEYSFMVQVKKPQPNLNMTRAIGIGYKPRIFNSLFNVYVGYREFYVLEKPKNGVSFGIGLDLNLINFYAAYNKSDYYKQDNNIYFSANVSFDEIKLF